MSKVRRLFADLTSGQNDTRLAEGLELPRWEVFQNLRVSDGSARCRKGHVLLDTVTSSSTALDLTAASSHYVSFPNHLISGLGNTLDWTMEWLIRPDSVTGTQTIVGFGHATVFPFRLYLDGTSLKFYCRDESSGTSTLTHGTALTVDTTYAVQIRRSGTTLSMYVDGVYSTQDASLFSGKLQDPAVAMYIGRDNSGNYFDGKVDFFRAYKYVAADCSMAFRRWPTPRAPYMLFDYGGDVDGNDVVLDRSQYENHGIGVNSPGTTTTLAVNPAPVQLIHPYRDRSNRTRVLVLAGGTVFSVEV